MDENKKNSNVMSDEELVGVTGGGIVGDFFKNLFGGNNHEQPGTGTKNSGEYVCETCGKNFTWTLETDPICPSCHSRYNLRRLADVLTAGQTVSKL